LALKDQGAQITLRALNRFFLRLLRATAIELAQQFARE
jgi:hypothetical protein